ncbi:MAG TPA: tRNA-dihydrouridine synthase [Patescibacteria group bacterium]|nr:tRNA-dihydrouridine synthase [Patescibacteria group bacterium]
MQNFWQKLPKPFLALSPMVGVTDLPFRLTCRKYGADLVYTEMIMVQALAHKNKKTMELAAVDKKEMPIVLQLGGNDPELFYKASKIAAEEIRPSGLDLNFGCPAKKVAGHGSGVALLRDLNRSREIIQAAIEGAQGLPVSLKTRTQIKTEDKGKTITSLDLLEKIKDLPLAAVMIHGRSFEAPWIEEVDYGYIRKVRELYNGILIANGGIDSPMKAKQVLKLTRADGLAIGHGVYGQPWIFNQVKQYLKTGRYDDLPWDEKRKIAIEHAKLAFRIKGEHGLIELRKQLLWYVKGLPNATGYRSQLVQLKTVGEIKKALMDIKPN